MLTRLTRRLGAIAMATALAACGGGNDPMPTPTPTPPPADTDTDTGVPAPPAPAKVGTLTGTVFKGPVHGARVCVYALQSGAKGTPFAAQSGSLPAIADGCVVTAADGSFSFVLPPATTGELLVESTGGTYCSDESLFDGSACTGGAGGTAVALGSNALRTVATAPEDGTVSAPVTLLTTAAAEAAGTLDASAFSASYQTIAGNFGAPADPASAPGTGALNTALQKLAVYLGPSTADLAGILSGIATGTLVAGNTDFPVGVELAVGADQKSMRVFTVSAGGVTQVSSAMLPGIPGSYSRSGSTVTVRMPAHGIRDGLQIRLSFAAGTGGAATSGTYPVTEVDADTFTLTDTASGTITGGTLYRDPVTRLTGTYSQASGTSYVTITVPSHGLQSGDAVDLAFTSGGATHHSSVVSGVVNANTFRVVLDGPAAAAASGDVTVSVGTNYSTFDAVMHPSGRWLYAASAYDCPNFSPSYCWGGDTITTFRIDWQRGQLTPLAAVRTGSNSAYAMPARLAFNGAGTRMVHLDEDLEGLVLWSVNADTGALTRVADSGAGTSAFQGVVFSADGQYVYNGGRAFSVTDTAITLMAGLQSGGNSGDIVDDVLFFTQPPMSLHAFSLAMPNAPMQLAASGSVNTSRDSSTRNGSVILTSGRGGIKSYTFDGMALAAAAPATGSAELQRDGSGALETGAIMYESVKLNKAGTLAVGSYFAEPAGVTRRGGPPSGYVFTQVGADGRLTHIATSETAQFARAAKFIKQPN